ncbi:hypothetical protein CC2G_008243 [Coprinopsis cinerea AmutBmut pab1-1]|nr:hypothetical protein CC2G_008243 [Coprinopsis cinerea AmutBmut pab1-1]
MALPPTNRCSTVAEWAKRARAWVHVNEDKFMRFCLSGFSTEFADGYGVTLDGTTLSRPEIELVSGDLTIAPLGEYHHEPMKDLFLFFDIKLPSNQGRVVTKPLVHLATHPIGTWGPGTRLHIGFSGFATVIGDESNIGADKYEELYRLGIHPALGIEHDTAGDSPITIPHDNISTFTDQLRASLEDHGVHWAGDIFFVHEVVDMSRSTQHDARDRATSRDWLNLAFSHYELSLAAALSGEHGTWYVGVGMDIASASGKCFLWNSKKHSDLLYHLAKVDIIQSHTITTTNKASYSRHTSFHLSQAAGCEVRLSDTMMGQTGLRYWSLSHTHAVASPEPITPTDVFTGRAIQVLDRAFESYRAAAYTAGVGLRVEGVVAIGKAVDFLVDVPYIALDTAIFVLEREELWPMLAYRMLAMRMATELQIVRTPYNRLQAPSLLLAAGIAFLANTIDTTATISFPRMGDARYFLPTSQSNTPGLGGPVFDRIGQGDSAPRSVYNVLYLRQFLDGFPEFVESPMIICDRILEAVMGASLDQLAIAARTETVAAEQVPPRRIFRLPPQSTKPWYQLHEHAYATDRLDIVIPPMHLTQHHFTHGLPRWCEEMWLQYVNDIISGIPSKVPSRRNNHSSDSFCALTPAQLANADMGIFQNLRLSDIFTEVQWIVVRDEEELMVVFDSHFPDRDWESEDPAFASRRYYDDWVAFTYRVSRTEVVEAKKALFRLFRMLCWIPWGDGGVWETRPDRRFTRFGGADLRLPAPKILILRGEPMWELAG